MTDLRTIDELLQDPVLNYRQIADIAGVPYYKVHSMARDLKEEGVVLPERKVGPPRRIDYARLDELLQSSDLTMVEIAARIGCSRVSVYIRRNEVLYGAATSPVYDYTSIDEWLKDPALGYKEIAQAEGVSYSLVSNRVNVLRRAGIDVPNRKHRPRESKFAARNLKILEDVLSLEYSQSEIVLREGVSKQRISQILLKRGIDGMDLRSKRFAIESMKIGERKKVVDIIAQYAFDRTIEEQGLPYALAERDHKYYARCSRSWSIDDVAKLIEARLQGNGYLRCAKYAGVAQDTREAIQSVSSVAKILKHALHDVPYVRTTKQFGEGRSLSGEEEERFKEMCMLGATNEMLAFEFDIPYKSVSYHKGRLGIQKWMNDYTDADRLLREGKSYKEVAELTGIPMGTLSSRKRKLRESSQL